MKLLKRFLIILSAFLIMLFAGISVYVKFFGKDFVVTALQNSLDREVSVGEVSYHFPLSLQAEKIRIGHLIKGKKFFEAQYFTARLSSEAIYRWQLIFDRVTLDKPEVTVEKISASGQPERRYGVVIPPEQPDTSTTNKNIDGTEKIEDDERAEISIKQLILNQGRFQYTNRSIDKDFSFTMEDVHLKAEHLAFPFKAERTNLSVSGRLIKEGNPLSGSTIDGGGWVDIVSRDMKASVEITEADGSVGMTAEAVSKNNAMEVKGEVKFQNILMGTARENSTDTSAVSNLISSALSSAGVQIGAKFSFKTKMDDFHPEQVSFSGNVVTK